MKKTILLFIFACAFIAPKAQEDIIIGQKFTMYSDVIGEERAFLVYLPDSYNKAAYAKAKYPVVYVLDGEKNFLTAVSVQKTFTRGMYNNMPECIVVGVVNTDRTRDMTPSKSVWVHNGKELFKGSGGAENFTVFLTNELRGHIDSHYRTNGYNILVGHSFGGLFAVNTLVHHTEAFNAYVVIDPSIWWDNRRVYVEAGKIWKDTDFGHRSVYMAMAKSKDEPGDGQQHSAAIKDFCENILLSVPENNLNAYWRYFGTEDHGTVLMPAIYDAFRTIFEGISLPVREVPLNPQIITETYARLSRKLAHSFVPDEALLDNIGNYAISVDEPEGAARIFEYQLECYPGSKKAAKNLLKLKSK